MSSLIDRCAQNKGRPLPKFGEWDVKNPATADGFTVIFQKARDNKKTTGGPGQSGIPPAFRNGNGYGYGSGSGSPYKTGNSYPYSRVASPKRIKKKWFFCGSF
ncbi:protein NOI4-like [Lolium rigidum]|uniref:protein NOI4-like n=1 Tax=Lolium rigidum TaxID=89674 RepID=UPI001F5C6ABB|nr:protein NOI4-like [Lolium rigidum]